MSTANTTIPNTTTGLIAQYAVIASGTSLSELVTLKSHALNAIIMPAVWTAASITIQASIDGTNFFNVYTAAGAEYTITTAASRYITIPASDLTSVKYLYFRSGTSGTPVSQAQDSKLTILCK